PAEAMQAAPAADDPSANPTDSAAGSIGAIVAAQSSGREPSVPPAPPSFDARSDARSDGKPVPGATADAVGTTRPPAHPNIPPWAGVEPAVEPTASTGAVRPASLGPWAIPAAPRRPDQAPLQTPAGDDLPAGIGTNRLRAAAAGGDPAAQYEVA